MVIFYSPFPFSCHTALHVLLEGMLFVKNNFLIKKNIKLEKVEILYSGTQDDGSFHQKFLFEENGG